MRVLIRWLSTIVALPIVMYTSWILYERGKFPHRYCDSFSKGLYWVSLFLFFCASF